MLILKWLISFGCGLASITTLQSLDYQSLAYFFSSIIINPIAFFIGTFCFFISIIGFSSFIRGIIKQTYDWITKKEKPTYKLIVNYSSLLCIAFMYSKSFWITTEILLISLLYGMISVELNRVDKYLKSGGDGD
ncbi:hypothetical protein [Bacillus sp. Marseille-P3661]|uniref:hypothetical protein n=1 Tax=Bacillus sp. Marseille-P3661 TaxID=1936234 RepID=UPI000C8641D4|nr:hypothetical protein [Bacillus sp. Marseille-P3661]